MPESRSRGPVLLRRDRVRNVRHALLHSLAGRAIGLGLFVRVATYIAGLLLGTVPRLFGVLDTVASVALAAGAAYFVFQLLAVAKRLLLWRVRRKLILSYVFIGFVPAILIVAFFLLSGFLLLYNFSSYLVQSRLRALSDQARAVAEGTVLDIQSTDGRDVAGIIRGKQAGAAGRFEKLSIAVVPVDRACAGGSGGAARSPDSLPATAGRWSHVEAPDSVPRWIDCKTFAGVLAYSAGPASSAAAGEHGRTATDDTHILIRAAAFPDSSRASYAVVVDLPVDDQVTEQLRRDTGVEIMSVSTVDDTARGARPIQGRGDDRARPAAAGAVGGRILGNLRGPLEYRDWASGSSGTLIVVTQLNIAEFYDRISSAQGPAEQNFGQSLLLVLFIIGGLFMVIECMALFAGFALARSITGSVHELFGGTERVRQGDFSHKIAVKTRDQLGELAVSFNSMTDSIEGLLREAAEKKRLEEELRIAREIQMSLLPQGPLVMEGLSVTALCIPAREVGGDYYDFFRLGERRLAILIADVSGKGTSAALYMAELKGLVLSLSRIHASPRDLMVAADRIIAANLDARSFITMTYAVVDLDAGTMTYARAGHTPLMYVPHPGVEGDGRVRVLAPDGMVLGLNLDDGERFERLLEEQTIELHGGDLALFFTDGITEAMNKADECFGEDRLGRLLETHAHVSPAELRELVLGEVQTFAAGAPQHDDMTMILLKIDGVGARAIVGAQTDMVAVRPA